MLMGWSIAGRRSELANTNVEDLEIRERGIVATIRRQKNDQTGQGYRKAVVLAEDPTLCTTMAIRR